MKAFLLAFLLASTHVVFAQDGPVAVPKSDCPNGAFSLRLTHDRAKETELKYVARAEVQIVANGSGQTLASFPYPAGTSSDQRPPHAKVQTLWNRDGTVVAIGFAERFYTHFVVYRLQGTSEKPEKFAPLRLPDRVAMIQSMVPGFRRFLPPWRESLVGWSSPTTLDFSSTTTAIVHSKEEGERTFRANFYFSVDIADHQAPVISRVERGGEGE